MCSEVQVKGKGTMVTYFLGERLTKIPKSRQLYYVEKENDLAVIQEVSSKLTGPGLSALISMVVMTNTTVPLPPRRLNV